MSYLFLSLFWFLVAVAIHALYCRRTSSADLQMSFFVKAALGAGICLGMSAWGLLIFRGLEETALLVTAAVLYVLLIPCYLTFYFGTKVDSPSKKILQALEDPQGVTMEDLAALLTDESLLAPRIQDLLRTRYLDFNGQQYRLTARGVFLGKILNAYETMTGRPLGG